MENLGPEDLDAISLSSLPFLLALARFNQHIKDGKCRAEVIERLCAHPDPLVRLEPAQNPGTSLSALRRLGGDPDLDVAGAALENLKEE